jgi:F0F1-type ATP synthase assembly protein I
MGHREKRSGDGKMKTGKNEKRDESLWVTMARYSEIGFVIPAAVMAGYLLGMLGDYLFHTHWIRLVGIIFGAVTGFVSMIRRALEASKDEEEQEGPDERK